MSLQRTRSRLILGCFCPPPGHHLAAWRLEGVEPGACVDLEVYMELVQKLEKSFFDFFFISDGVGVRTHYESLDSLSRWGRIVQFEPTTLMAALATVTKNLGLVATASTSYHEPFNVARKFASLDLISQGRMAWNIVTSVTDAEAQNFNRQKQMPHQERYERADEFVQVVRGLWNSWDADAFVYDKENGRYFNPEKARILNHQGKYFSVRGPLNVPRSPQDYPVLVQAGSSETGKGFAARWAEIMFTAQDSLDDAIAFRKEMRERASASGRNPDDIRIMPGVVCVVGETDEDAFKRLNWMQSLVSESVAKEMLMGQLGDVPIDWSRLDEPVSELPATNGSQSRQQLLFKRASREGLTLRQLMNLVSIGRGHLVAIGSGQKVANLLAEWFECGAVDGFNIMPTHYPEGLDMFIEHVLPVLREKKLIQTSYKSTQLRSNIS